MKKFLKKLLYPIFRLIPTYRQLQNVQHRLSEIEISLRNIEREVVGRDNSLESGERVVATSISDVIPSHTVRYEMVLEKAKNAKRILDIACGIGYGCYMLSESSPNSKIIGVDISEDTISFAKTHYKKENVSYICGSIDDIKDEEEFDLITCFETIEHIADDRDFLDKIAKLLKNGGTLFLSTPNEEIISVNQGNHFHYRHYKYENLIKILKDRGICVKNTKCQISDDDYELLPGHNGMYIVLEAIRQP